MAMIAGLWLSSCNRPDKPPEGEEPPGAPNLKSSMSTVKISELNHHPESGTVTYAGKLYSGQAIALNPDGSRSKEYHYHEGLKHGPVREFYENGGNKSDTLFVKGVAHGDAFEWDREGKITYVAYENGEEVKRADGKINMSPEQNKKN